jgi:transcriptional regulator with XRE-family HTH domain
VIQSNRQRETMTNPETEPDRVYKLGELITTARHHARRDAEACARAVGLTVEAFTEVEQGQRVLSLPQLEVLAMFLERPMAYFWGSAAPAPERERDYSGYLDLRQRIIGAQLRQARMDTHRSLEEAAEAVGRTPEKIAAYEAGTEPVPFFVLEAMARYLGVSVRDLSEDKHGPLSQHEARLALQRQAESLPMELRAFIAEPVNLRYVELAHRLSKLDADRLRAIAESILEITL